MKHSRRDAPHTRYNFVGSRQTIARRTTRGALKRGLERGGVEKGELQLRVPAYESSPGWPRVRETSLPFSRTPETVGVASNLMDCTDTYGQIATNNHRRPTPRSLEVRSSMAEWAHLIIGNTRTKA